jgi:hypothetical protein
MMCVKRWPKAASADGASLSLSTSLTHGARPNPKPMIWSMTI